MNKRKNFVLYRFFQKQLFFKLCLLALYALIPLQLIAQEAKNQQSLLWKITGNNLKQPSYVYGTIHAICPDDLQLTGTLQDALQNSQQLALEVDITSLKELQQLQAGMQMKTPQKLSDFMAPQEYRLVERFYRDSLGVALAQLQNMKPFFISSLLYSKLLNCPVLSYEMQLARMMGLQDKPVVGLETAAAQLRALDAITYQEQAQLLVEAVKKWEELKAEYWNLVVSYKNQDLESLFHIVRETSLGIKDYESVLLHERNLRWIPGMEILAHDKPTFFAVGAAHLPGESGLVKLLRRRGYKVEPVLEPVEVKD